jgi:hypothetical protein
MDGFVSDYFFFLFIVLGGVILFWGIVIYFVVKFLKSKSDFSTEQKLGILTRLMQAYSGRPGGHDPMDSKVGGVAASQGIDLNDHRS